MKTNRQNQQGTVLLISLIFLVLLTIAGVSSLKIGQADTKVADNFIDKQIALAAADSAMSEAYSSMAKLAANFQNSDIGTTFNSSCTGGLCFDGSFAGSTCTLNKEDWEVNDAIYQNDAIWSKRASSTSDKMGALNNAKYLIEFRCFDSTGTAPKFRLVTLGSGKSSDSRVMLVSEFSLVTASPTKGSVPAVLAVNTELDSTGGSNIHAYYCHNGCQRDVDGNLDYVFDPDAIPGIAYNSCKNTACNDTIVTGLVDTLSCTKFKGNGTCHTTASSQVAYTPSTITTLSGDDFFAQYFNATKSQVETGTSTLVVDLSLYPDKFNSLTASDIAGYSAVYVKGNVNGALAFNTLSNVLNKDVSLVVDGDFDLAGASIVNAGFMYVSGDTGVNGTLTANGFVAIEGKASVFGSITLYPQGNPLDNTSWGGGQSGNGAQLAADSWFQSDIQF